MEDKIKLIKKDVKNLEGFKNYDLVILCMGGQSKIYNEITKIRSIKKDYKEVNKIFNSNYLKFKIIK